MSVSICLFVRKTAKFQITSKLICRCIYVRNSVYAWASLLRSSINKVPNSSSAPSKDWRTICICNDLDGLDSLMYASRLRTWVDRSESTSGKDEWSGFRSERRLQPGPKRSFKRSGTALRPRYKYIDCPFSACQWIRKGWIPRRYAPASSRYCLLARTSKGNMSCPMLSAKHS